MSICHDEILSCDAFVSLLDLGPYGLRKNSPFDLHPFVQSSLAKVLPFNPKGLRLTVMGALLGELSKALQKDIVFGGDECGFSVHEHRFLEMALC